MAFTPQDVITEVRRAVQDTRQPYRYDDTHMLGVVNQCVKRVALLRPDLFCHVADIELVAGSRQTAPADSIRLMAVFGTTDGTQTINEVNRDTLDRALVGWQAQTPGTPTDWMRHPRNPNLFFVYPPAIASTEITVEYAKSPDNYALTDSVELQDGYFPCVVDGSVWLLESVDNEHVNSGRAKMFMDSFVQGLGLTVQTKQITDNESGGADPRTQR